MSQTHMLSGLMRLAESVRVSDEAAYKTAFVSVAHCII